jgi:hypothetical protein
VIITQNLSDFPAQTLAPFGIEVPHPDNFAAKLLALEPDKFCAAVREVRARLKNPPYSVSDYLGTLTRIGLVSTASKLEQFADLL